MQNVEQQHGVNSDAETPFVELRLLKFKTSQNRRDLQAVVSNIER